MLTLEISFRVLTLVCFLLALVLPFTKANCGRWSWQVAGFSCLTVALFWPWR